MQAQARLHGERRALLKLLGKVEAKSQAYADAWAEVALASSADARDHRPKLARLVPPPDLAAMHAWADTPTLDALLDAQAQGAAAS